MKGSIRVLVGMLIAIGAMGTLDIDFDADVIVQTMIACVGLAIAYSGVQAMKKEEV